MTTYGCWKSMEEFAHKLETTCHNFVEDVMVHYWVILRKKRIVRGQDLAMKIDRLLTIGSETTTILMWR